MQHRLTSWLMAAQSTAATRLLWASPYVSVARVLLTIERWCASPSSPLHLHCETPARLYMLLLGCNQARLWRRRVLRGGRRALLLGMWRDRQSGCEQRSAALCHHPLSRQYVHHRSAGDLHAEKIGILDLFSLRGAPTHLRPPCPSGVVGLPGVRGRCRGWRLRHEQHGLHQSPGNTCASRPGQARHCASCPNQRAVARCMRSAQGNARYHYNRLASVAFASWHVAISGMGSLVSPPI